jgi:hypothetical protein
MTFYSAQRKNVRRRLRDRAVALAVEPTSNDFLWLFLPLHSTEEPQSIPYFFISAAEYRKRWYERYIELAGEKYRRYRTFKDVEYSIESPLSSVASFIHKFVFF